MFGCCLQVASGGSEVARTSADGMRLTGLLASMLSSCVCVLVFVVVSDHCGCLSMSGVTLRLHNLVNERSHPPLA